MTDKFKPVPNISKTETKIVLNDWQQPVKKSNLSVAARSKVVNRSGGNYLSESKDYGPCSPSYCSDCSCPRSDCNCRSGEGFVKLWTVCPAMTCPERDNYPRYPSHWVHATDNRYTWISNQARIRCEGSYCSTNHMSQWKFRCSAHRGEHDYRETGKEAFQKALGWALVIKKDSSTSQVITDLIAWIVSHPGEWD